MEADWTAVFLSDTREIVGQMLSAVEEDPDMGLWAKSVVAARDRMGQQARPLTDLHLADTLTSATLHLLDKAATTTREDRQLASVVARYFATNLDGDLSSPYGFDDDVEVFNAVAAQIAPDLVLAG